MARIQVNKEHYIYCNVDDNPYSYNEYYDSSEECLKKLIPSILENIKEENDIIQEKVVNHYSCVFNNSSCGWENIYKF